MYTYRFRNFCTLVDVGSVDIDAIDSNGRTPLMVACYLSSKPIAHLMVRKLLHNGANVNRVDPFGHTVLHHAAICHHLPILELVLETTKANAIQPDKGGNTPLHVAVQVQDLQLIRALLDHMRLYQISSEQPNNNGLTPLLLACKLGRVDIARYLVKLAHHSPMKCDSKMHRDGRLWLETILFIPYDLDPFNCFESELMRIQPKPVAYVSKDCKQFAITCGWHNLVLPGESTRSSRQRSAPGSIRIPSLSPPFSSATKIQQSSKLIRKANALRKSKSSEPTCTELLPHFLALKAASVGVRPAAQSLYEEKTSSENELMEMEEYIDGNPQFRNSDLLGVCYSAPKSRKFSSRDRSAKHVRIGSVHDVMAMSATWSKMPLRRRKSNNCCN